MEQWKLWGPQHAKDQEQFARAIGDVTLDRALDNGGVVNEYLEYSDRRITPLLMEAYAARTHQRRNCKKPTFDAKVKWDPTDLSKVSVFDPVAGKYRKVPAKKRRYTTGLTLAMHKLVLRYRGAQSLMADPEGEARLLELRRMAETELRTISREMEIKEQRARAAIMQQPVLRDMMGGDIHLVQVKPSPTGMEVKHDHGIGRVDALEKAPRAKRGSQANDANRQMDGDEYTEVNMSVPAAFQQDGQAAGEQPDGEQPDGGVAISTEGTSASRSAGGGDVPTYDGDAGAAPAPPQDQQVKPDASDTGESPDADSGDDDDILGTFEDY